MRVKTVVMEDFTNYKKPSMFIGCISCNGKCCTEGGYPLSVCINDQWRDAEIQTIDDDYLITRYINNPITSAIVFGLLEPFEQFDELLNFVKSLRLTHNCNDEIIVFTGFSESEISDKIRILSQYKNIIVKFGRYVMGQEKHYDEVLGVYLASDNQFGKVIS